MGSKTAAKDAEDAKDVKGAKGEERYEIGVVSRLTGLSAPNIRIWEKRYGVIAPERTPSRRRVYTREEVRKLTLLKSLVDEGHSIARIAELSVEQLEDRLRQSEVAAEHFSVRGREVPVTAGRCRILFAGATLGSQVREEPGLRSRVELVKEFADLEAAGAAKRLPAAQLCLVECPTLFPETIEEVQQLVSRCKARRAVVVYRFSQLRTVRRIDKDIPGITALRAPVNTSELKLACLADFEMAGGAGREEELVRRKVSFAKGGIPERVFSDAQLVEIGKVSPAIECECPLHLSSLLASLAAFEDYSQKCEDRNPADAEMHAFLHESTAQARASLEHALEDLLEAEGIEV